LACRRIDETAIEIKYDAKADHDLPEVGLRRIDENVRSLPRMTSCEVGTAAKFKAAECGSGGDMV
jgi:hypothetical protein